MLLLETRPGYTQSPITTNFHGTGLLGCVGPDSDQAFFNSGYAPYLTETITTSSTDDSAAAWGDLANAKSTAEKTRDTSTAVAWQDENIAKADAQQAHADATTSARARLFQRTVNRCLFLWDRCRGRDWSRPVPMDQRELAGHLSRFVHDDN